MFEPLLMPEEMAEWDRISMEELGFGSEMLMENACREALAVLKQDFDSLAGLKVSLLAGPGNNGGDAFGLARHLANHGAMAAIWHTAPTDSYQGSAAYHLGLAQKCGVPAQLLTDLDEPWADQPDIVVDGLLGTGFRGPLRGPLLELINRMNQASAYIFSLDIPSGLNGHNGRAEPAAVEATTTVTFQAAKVGLVMPGAEKYVGRLVVREIGLPRAALDKVPHAISLMTRQSALALMPKIQPDMYKGTAGHVLVLGGSRGLAGAPLLSSLGALRSGTGLVTLACPAGLARQIRPAFPEIMVWPLGDQDGWSADLVDQIIPFMANIDALALGPGLGREEATGRFVRALLERLGPDRPPLLLDADGLYWLSQDHGLARFLGPEDILTPHPGEMARLAGKSTAEVQDSRLETAREAARVFGANCVLKGPVSIIASPDGTMCLSPFSAPNLAVGGSGDVLSGICASLLAQGLKALPAACLGVYWHGLCGQFLAQVFPRRGNLASEIAHHLPHCWENDLL